MGKANTNTEAVNQNRGLELIFGVLNDSSFRKQTKFN